MQAAVVRAPYWHVVQVSLSEGRSISCREYESKMPLGETSLSPVRTRRCNCRSGQS
jgi:hypothetical protein